MPSQNDVPEGFVSLSDPDANIRPFMIVDNENWVDGSVVTYSGVREWTSANGESRRVHTVAMENDNGGPLAGIWSTAVLDRLLRQVAVGERVFLRYDGKGPDPRLPSRDIHRWFVARAPQELEAPAPKAGRLH